MKDKILEVINENVQEQDMMEYTEVELESLVRRISNKINRPVAIWVDSISDGKYRINIRENKIEKSVDTLAWDSKESFAECISYLFE